MCEEWDLRKTPKVRNDLIEKCAAMYGDIEQTIFKAVEKMSEVAALTERHHCGVLVEPGDAVQLAEAILRLADQPELWNAMGMRSRVAAELFSRERQVAAHAELLTEVASL